MQPSKLELTEDQINSYPAGEELNELIAVQLMGYDRKYNKSSYYRYSNSDFFIESVCNTVVEKLGLYQLTYIENHRIDHSSDDTPMLRVFYAFDGVAQPWGWGETKALAACRFALKALLYRQMNIESGAWPK